MAINILETPVKDVIYKGTKVDKIYSFNRQIFGRPQIKITITRNDGFVDQRYHNTESDAKNHINEYMNKDINEALRMLKYEDPYGLTTALPVFSNFSFSEIYSVDYSNCNMKNIKFLNSLFTGCSNLVSVVFPIKTKSLPIVSSAYCFFGCTSLSKVEINLSCFDINSETGTDYMFSDTGLKVVYVDTHEKANILNASKDKDSDVTVSVLETPAIHLFGRNIGVYQYEFIYKAGKTADQMRDFISSMTDYYGNDNIIKELQYVDEEGLTTSAANLFKDCISLTSLNLVDFNMINTTNVDNIVQNCTAITEAYCKTQEDCDRLNTSLNKPDNVNFIIKQ